MEIWSTDIGNAYIESYTSEKVCIIAGEEFGELQGHLLIIVQALYGLRTSGKCWHDRFADVLYDMDFKPCYADNDVWMRDMGDHHEHIGVYVDDLQIASKDPKAITDILAGKFEFLLKDVGPMEFHLGCDYSRDEEGVLMQRPTKYLERIEAGFVSIFGHPPRHYRGPLEKGDNLELDASPLLDEEGIAQYQSVIGSLQWAVSLGRFDIGVAVMTLSSFRVAPRKGHLDRAKRIVGYLVGMKHGCIRYRTEDVDLSDCKRSEFDWKGTPYKDAKEELPYNCPEPKGATVDTITYVDANLYHNMLTGRSVSGILHLLGKTPIDWFAKLQNTVETSTYGSEFVAARIATEQIMDLRNTLRYMGVPVGRSVMFGDSKVVLASSTLPHSQLKKRHNALSYHRVREAIAAGIYDFYHIEGAKNPADILSKHWGYSDVWRNLQVLLFWQGDTMDLCSEEDYVDS